MQDESLNGFETELLNAFRNVNSYPKSNILCYVFKVTGIKSIQHQNFQLIKIYFYVMNTLIIVLRLQLNLS